MVDRYFSTIPRPYRFQIAGQIIRCWSDQLIDLPLYYDIDAVATNHRVPGPAAANCPGNPGGCRG